MKTTHTEILDAIAAFAETNADLPALQTYAVDTIAAKLPTYNWVGFYMLDPADRNMLMLGPFHGAPTEHVRIPVTEGICGAAVAQDETVVIDDVSSDPRYLACSLETRSEIVVPIRVRGTVVGEIDIDSHTLRAFGDDDREFVEACAVFFGEVMQQEDYVSK